MAAPFNGRQLRWLSDNLGLYLPGSGQEDEEEVEEQQHQQGDQSSMSSGMSIASTHVTRFAGSSPDPSQTPHAYNKQ